MEISPQISPLESSIDQGFFVNVVEDGLVTAMTSEPTTITEDVQNEHVVQKNLDEDAISNIQMDDHTNEKTNSPDDIVQPQGQGVSNIVVPIRKCLNQLSRHTRKSIWLLAYIALITSWPLLGSGLRFLFNRKFRNVLQVSKKR